MQNEKFNKKKFAKGFDLTDPVSWSKIISTTWKLLIVPLVIAGILFFIKQSTLALIVLAVSFVLLVIGIALKKKSIINTGIIIIAIAGGIFIYGVYQGYQSAPAIINLKDVQFTTPSGDKCKVVDKRIYCEGKLIRNKDIKELERLGLSLRPSIFIAGFRKQPIGVGAEILNLGKWNLDAAYFPLTTIGAGVSYDILNFKNFGQGSVGIMPTYDFRRKDVGVIGYFKWRF